jgi:hypothetical protein
VSNSFIERVFSLSEGQWTDDRNRLCVSTVASILKVQVNFGHMKCPAMHAMLSNNLSLLKKIISGEKYA